jgi:hypothetical protein
MPLSVRSRVELKYSSLPTGVASVAAPARPRCRLWSNLHQRSLPVHEPGVQPEGCHGPGAQRPEVT